MTTKNGNVLSRRKTKDKRQKTKGSTPFLSFVFSLLSFVFFDSHTRAPSFVSFVVIGVLCGLPENG